MPVPRQIARLGHQVLHDRKGSLPFGHGDCNVEAVGIGRVIRLAPRARRRL